MNLFEEQLFSRQQRDDELFASMLQSAGDIWRGKGADGEISETDLMELALRRIFRFYRLPFDESVRECDTPKELLEHALLPVGMARRGVRLKKGWYRNATGAMLGFMKDHGTGERRMVALIPRRISGYYCFDPASGRKLPVNALNAAQFEESALLFYRPLPAKKMKVWDSIWYMLAELPGVDILLLIWALLNIPFAINMLLLGQSALLENLRMPVETGTYFLFSASSYFLAYLGYMFITVFFKRMLSRIWHRCAQAAETAVMGRLLLLPSGFFRRYQAGDLATRLYGVKPLCRLVAELIFSLCILWVVANSCLYYVKSNIPVYSALFRNISILAFLLILASSVIRMGTVKRERVLAAKEYSLSYLLLTAIKKVRLAGALKRLFARWGELYIERTRLRYHPHFVVRYGAFLQTALMIAGTWYLYDIGYLNGITKINFYMIMMVWGLFTGAYRDFAATAGEAVNIPSLYELIRPVLETVPECAQSRQAVDSISGAVSLKDVCFRYERKSPLLIEHFNLDIRKGEYVALIGDSGSGKTTILKLMLGMERAESGTILFDDHPIETLQLQSLRSHMGCVLQDGKLIAGDIFTNIALCSPGLTMEEAFQAADQAGIGDDIRRMPMGMHTMLSDGGKGVSTGQRQRVLIARALAAKPSILFLDEATPGLDRLSGSRVMDTIKNLSCTRIVIAHSPDAVMDCDRILLMKHGRIVEEGTPAELMAGGKLSFGS